MDALARLFKFILIFFFVTGFLLAMQFMNGCSVQLPADKVGNIQRQGLLPFEADILQKPFSRNTQKAVGLKGSEEQTEKCKAAKARIKILERRNRQQSDSLETYIQLYESTWAMNQKLKETLRSEQQCTDSLQQLLSIHIPLSEETQRAKRQALVATTLMVGVLMVFAFTIFLLRRGVWSIPPVPRRKQDNRIPFAPNLQPESDRGYMNSAA
jgi:preprotein translocase subunit SecF